LIKKDTEMAKKKAKRTGTTAAATPIESVRHKQKRKNIPTEELRDFVRKEDQAERPVLYPRDPSLDPQLVWKGKDEQDFQPLAVPAVPIYIQEKIHPQHIIEDLRASLARPAKERDVQEMFDFYDDFNGLPEEFGKRTPEPYPRRGP
jgi:adenine-specific DNA-methyltransferase